MEALKRGYRFSVEKYNRMIELGVLTKSDRVELIRGEIINKMPIGEIHIATVNRLNFAFTARVHGRCLVQIQSPIRLVDSQPEPDVSLIEFRSDFYASGKATPADVRLLIEVSDTSLEYDREIKIPLYAENGIAEFWIVNLIESQIEVFRQPTNGAYSLSFIRRKGEAIDLLAFPGEAIPVDQLLP